jgi:hypothetical protein
MSQYYGDIQLGDTVQWTITTVDTTPVPTTIAGSPTLTAYTNGGLTQSATGATLTVDFDGVTGLHLISIVATSGNGFAAGENIEIVMEGTGTVGGNSITGYAVGSFSIENRSNLRPTTVGNNEVDVTATGAVGIDWANVEGQGTTVDLSATDINLVDTTTTNTDMRGTDNAALASVATEARLSELDAVTAGKMANQVDIIQTDTTTDIPATITTLQSDTDDIQTRLPAALVGGAMDSDVSNMQTAAINQVARATSGFQKNTANSDITFLMVDDTDHVTAKTGLSLTGTRSIDGGSFGAITGTTAEISSGIYQFDASAADMNGDKIIFRFTGTAADDVFIPIKTVA